MENGSAAFILLKETEETYSFQATEWEDACSFLVRTPGLTAQCHPEVTETLDKSLILDFLTFQMEMVEVVLRTVYGGKL